MIDALGLKRYVLVGHSMGGKVAQLMASRRPRGLEGLVLVAPSPPTAMRLSAAERATLRGAYQSRESVEFVIDHVLTARPLDAACREQVIEDSLKAAPQAKAAWPDVAMAEDICAAVESIDVPTLVISGERDQVDRVATLEAELLPRIPHAAMYILPDTGHLSPLEAPADVAQTIASFVAAIENRCVVCNTPADVPAAFDAAMNAGDLNAVLRVFSNTATMRMTNGDVAQERPGLIESSRSNRDQRLVGPDSQGVPQRLANPIATYHRRQDISGETWIFLDSPSAVAIPVMTVWHVDAHIESSRKQSVTQRFAHAQ